jgi:hypothetical protein
MVRDRNGWDVKIADPMAYLRSPRSIVFKEVLNCYVEAEVAIDTKESYSAAH